MYRCRYPREENKVDDFLRKLPNGESFMIFVKHGATHLVEKGYKTVKKYGPNVIEISEFHFMDFHLKCYIERSRLKLEEQCGRILACT